MQFMQSYEYLQVSINYYSSADDVDDLSKNETAGVWMGLHDYLDSLLRHGWIIINETKSDKSQSRTYQFKRAVEAK